MIEAGDNVGPFVAKINGRPEVQCVPIPTSDYTEGELVKEPGTTSARSVGKNVLCTCGTGIRFLNRLDKTAQEVGKHMRARCLVSYKFRKASFQGIDGDLFCLATKRRRLLIIFFRET
eukprot:1624133-Amphidinium_carterae.1